MADFIVDRKAVVGHASGRRREIESRKVFPASRTNGKLSIPQVIESRAVPGGKCTAEGRDDYIRRDAVTFTTSSMTSGSLRLRHGGLPPRWGFMRG